MKHLRSGQTCTSYTTDPTTGLGKHRLDYIQCARSHYQKRSENSSGRTQTNVVSDMLLTGRLSQLFTDFLSKLNEGDEELEWCGKEDVLTRLETNLKLHQQQLLDLRGGQGIEGCDELVATSSVRKQVDLLLNKLEGMLGKITEKLKPLTHDLIEVETQSSSSDSDSEEDEKEEVIPKPIVIGGGSNSDSNSSTDTEEEKHPVVRGDSIEIVVNRTDSDDTNSNNSDNSDEKSKKKPLVYSSEDSDVRTDDEKSGPYPEKRTEVRANSGGDFPWDKVGLFLCLVGLVFLILAVVVSLVILGYGTYSAFADNPVPEPPDPTKGTNGTHDFYEYPEIDNSTLSARKMSILEDMLWLAGGLVIKGVIDCLCLVLCCALPCKRLYDRIKNSNEGGLSGVVKKFFSGKKKSMLEVEVDMPEVNPSNSNSNGGDH